MDQPFKIPAATTDDVDIALVASLSPEAADEIKRIGALIDTGHETDDDIIRLGELLHQFGQPALGEEKLRKGVFEEGDAIYKTYRRLFGYAADEEFMHSIEAFARQFNVQLVELKRPDFMKRVYSSIPSGLPVSTDPAISRQLSTPCRIEFKYEQGGSLADMGSESPDLPDDLYLLMKFEGGVWRLTGGRT